MLCGNFVGMRCHKKRCWWSACCIYLPDTDGLELCPLRPCIGQRLMVKMPPTVQVDWKSLSRKSADKRRSGKAGNRGRWQCCGMQRIMREKAGVRV